MGTHALFVDSSNSISLEPDFDFTQKDKKIQSETRTRGGALYQYKWGSFNGFKFKVEYVNSSDKSIINSWWTTNTELLFMEEGSTEVFSVVMRNKNLPIGKFMRPYTDEFSGVIELETY